MLSINSSHLWGFLMCSWCSGAPRSLSKVCWWPDLVHSTCPSPGATSKFQSAMQPSGTKNSAGEEGQDWSGKMMQNLQSWISSRISQKLDVLQCQRGIQKMGLSLEATDTQISLLRAIHASERVDFSHCWTMGKCLRTAHCWTFRQLSGMGYDIKFDRSNVL